jgi:hypothetical protein
MRSSCFVVLAFVLLAMSFGVMYSLAWDEFEPCLTTGRAALYYSITVVSGPGNAKPKDDGYWAQALTMVETIVLLYFLAVLVSIVASWAGRRQEA